MTYHLQKNWLYEQYWARGLSSFDIAKKISCAQSTIRRNLLKHNIPLRDYSEANKGMRNPFYGRKHTKKTRQKMSENHADFSGANHPLWGRPNPGASIRFSGFNNPKWQGGVCALRDRIRKCKDYKNWRLEVFKRDEFICQSCHIFKSRKLNAHHVHSFSLILFEQKIKTIDDAIDCTTLWDIRNGITLCEECHRKHHAARRSS